MADLCKLEGLKAIVRPTLGYASAIWDPYTNKNINAIEMIQRRVTGYVTNRYKIFARVSELLRELQWDLFEERKLRR